MVPKTPKFLLHASHVALQDLNFLVRYFIFMYTHNHRHRVTAQLHFISIIIIMGPSDEFLI
jgi:hypothetical protein